MLRRRVVVGMPTLPAAMARPAALLLCALGGASAQMSLPSEPDCDWATLPARVAALKQQCCNGGYYVNGNNCYAACTIQCAEQLLPLLDTCRPLLDMAFDMDDGVRDGVASSLDTLRTECLAIPEADVLDMLSKMNDAGTCPTEMLNNVARTAVAEAPCADARGNCDGLIAAGLRCKDATMQTDCRHTCELCHGHRRAQITAACLLGDFESQAAVVNTACCDDDDCVGVPTVCDAKCAIPFDRFFDQCSVRHKSYQLPFLSINIGPV